MVDGDQLNVIVDPLFVSIAERNLQKYHVVPLFYDANKAEPEIISYKTLFGGLKRAHEYSNSEDMSIGKISNMLTRLWNREKPDRIAAAWLTMFNNLVIDAAKSGILSHYENYPEVARRIYKAIGGKRGRLPYWFQYSKNGRKSTNKKKKRKYLEPTNSTMNRICAAFNDIGNINLHISGIPPFNWQMLLSAPCVGTNSEVCETFCQMDNVNISNIIESKDYEYATERETKAGYDLLAHMITEEMTATYGSLESTYPYIVKHLFAGKAAEGSTHKKMFWRVYGEIALENLKKNLADCKVCKDCGMRYPSWAEAHACPKDMKGFFTCVDCNNVYPQMNSKQCRCPECQTVHALALDASRKKNKYRQRQAEKEKRTGALVSRFSGTS